MLQSTSAFCSQVGAGRSESPVDASVCVESWPRSSADELRVARNQTTILSGSGPHEFSTCVIDGTLELTAGADWDVHPVRRLLHAAWFPTV